MFDPYHKWLGIPAEQQPPSYYQLLGVDPRETDPEVIEEMAVRQTSHVRTYQTGPHAEECRRLLTEIAQARRGLLDPARRRVYDQGLRRARATPVVAVAVPVATPAWVPTAVPLAAPGFPDLPVPIRRRLGRHTWHGVLALAIAFLLFATGGVAVWQALGEAPASCWWPDQPPAATEPARTPHRGPGSGREASRHDPMSKQGKSVLAPTPAEEGD
jgi:hypothetical protein